MNEFTGRHISIFIGGAVAHSAVFTRALHGTVDTETVKAIRVRFDNGLHLWFPKSALTRKPSQFADSFSFGLAKWFNFDNQQWRIVERVESIGGVSCA